MEAEVPTLIEILDQLTTEPVDLVGHSDGATIALLAATQRPDRVRSVVSVAAHTFVEPLTTSSIQRLLDDARRSGPPGWLMRFHGSRGMELLQAWASVWLGQAHAEWDVRAALSRMRCPVLAIQGDGDEFGSDEQLRVIAQRVRGAEIWRVRGVGHSPFADEEAFVERIAEFWSRA
jgi:pimeloyl-ACP methyl ester carboxylesterase